MKKFPRPYLLITLPVILLFFLSCGTSGVNIEKGGHTDGFRMYKNLPLKKIGEWIETDIKVSSGAIVVVMAKGWTKEVMREDKSWPPFRVMKFKVGNEGTEVRIIRGSMKFPLNVAIIKNEQEGPLFFHIRGRPQRRLSKLKVTVIIWDKDGQEGIPEDIIKLTQNHPYNRQYKFLWLYVGGLLTRTGEFSKADRLYEAVGSQLNISPDRHPPLCYFLARKEYLLGNLAKAENLATRCLELIKDTDNRRGKAVFLTLLANILAERGQYSRAMQLAEQVLEISEELSNWALTGTAHCCLGYINLQMNRLTEAAEHLMTARIFAERARLLGNEAQSLLLLGQTYMKMKENLVAKNLFQSAIQISTSLSYPGIIWISQSHLGKIAEYEGDYQSAYHYYKEAIKRIENIRGKVADTRSRAYFMEKKFYIYEWMIRLLLKMQKNSEALNYLERAKARALLDKLRNKAFFSEVKEENDLLDQERHIRKRMEEIQLENVANATGGNGELKSNTREIQNLEFQRQTILNKLTALNPELASLISIKPLRSQHIQALIDDETALLEYFLGEKNQWVFVLTKNKISAKSLVKSTDMINKMIKKLREGMVEKISLKKMSETNYQIILEKLYNVLIQPIANNIKNKKHIVIVPHGVLHYLPFHALIKEKERDIKYLIDSFSISYLPSASVLEYTRSKNRGRPRDILAVGNPATDLAPLPAAEQEAIEVSRLFDRKTVLIGKRATEAAVKDNSSSFETLLFSTHGEMIESQPLKSHLIFTPSKKDDGNLTVDEIFNMKIKSSLVTLSACETALAKGAGGKFPQGDDLIGLSRSFIYAGSSSVVASLWQVSDDSTIELILSFYRNLQVVSKAEALRRAQIELMRSKIVFNLQRGTRGITLSPGYRSGITVNCSHPYFWAPFILIGDWR